MAESWRRCEACGVRPDGSRLPPLHRTSGELAAYWRTHPLAAVLPLFRELLGAGAADDGHVFAVGDTDGTLLWVEGDVATVGRAERMHFAEGAVWSEALAGTNAPGLVLELGRPVQIVAGEHYSSAAHAWSCAAAPVRDPGTGRMLGVVDLTGGGTIATPPALAAVRGAALAGQLRHQAARAVLAEPAIPADPKECTDMPATLETATPGASPPPGRHRAIQALRAAHGGPVMFVQSGGCCDGSDPMNRSPGQGHSAHVPGGFVAEAGGVA